MGAGSGTGSEKSSKEYLLSYDAALHHWKLPAKNRQVPDHAAHNPAKHGTHTLPPAVKD